VQLLEDAAGVGHSSHLPRASSGIRSTGTVQGGAPGVFAERSIRRTAYGRRRAPAVHWRVRGRRRRGGGEGSLPQCPADRPRQRGGVKPATRWPVALARTRTGRLRSASRAYAHICYEPWSSCDISGFIRNYRRGTGSSRVLYRSRVVPRASARSLGAACRRGDAPLKG
jgi:hypothetical protein